MVVIIQKNLNITSLGLFSFMMDSDSWKNPQSPTERPQGVVFSGHMAWITCTASYPSFGAIHCRPENCLAHFSNALLDNILHFANH